jgi:hypothetical protein
MKLKGALTMSKLKKRCVWLSSCFSRCSLSCLLRRTKERRQASNVGHRLPEQGSDTNGYYVMGQDGKMYERMDPGLAA